MLLPLEFSTDILIMNQFEAECKCFLAARATYLK